MREFQNLEEEKIIKVKNLKKVKNNYEVTLSNDLTLLLDEETILLYRLVKGKEIDLDKLSEIKGKKEFFDAYSKAITYIGSSFKSKRQVKENLVKKGFSEYVIDDVLERLVLNNIINEDVYETEYISYLISSGYGELIIRKKLYERGLNKDKEIIKDDKYYESLKKLVESKKNYYNDLCKLKKFLLGRGYTYSDLNKIEDINE